MVKKQIKICAGFRETSRAAEEKKLAKIVLAEDTDNVFKAKAHALAHQHGIPLEFVSSSVELGQRAGIEVKTGIAGVWKK